MVRIVERERGRAQEIHRELKKVARELRAAEQPPRVEIDLNRRLRIGPSGTVSVEESIALLAESALELVTGSPKSGGRRAVEQLLAETSATRKVRELALEELQREGSSWRGGPAQGASGSNFTPDPGSADSAVRVSFWDDGQTIRAAAIHSAATVPERVITVGRATSSTSWSRR